MMRFEDVRIIARVILHQNNDRFVTLPHNNAIKTFRYYGVDYATFIRLVIKHHYNIITGDKIASRNNTHQWVMNNNNILLYHQPGWKIDAGAGWCLRNTMTNVRNEIRLAEKKRICTRAVHEHSVRQPIAGCTESSPKVIIVRQPGE